MSRMAIIHTKSGCIHCDMAKHILKLNDITYVEIVYDKTAPDYEEATRKLFKGIDQKTFPQIYINGLYIGGYSELRKRLPLPK